MYGNFLGYGHGFGLIAGVLAAIVWVIGALLVVAICGVLIVLLARFLWFGTLAARRYLELHGSPKSGVRATPPAAPAPAPTPPASTPSTPTPAPATPAAAAPATTVAPGTATGTTAQPATKPAAKATVKPAAKPPVAPAVKPRTPPKPKL